MDKFLSVRDFSRKLVITNKFVIGELYVLKPIYQILNANESKKTICMYLGIRMDSKYKTSDEFNCVLHRFYPFFNNIYDNKDRSCIELYDNFLYDWDIWELNAFIKNNSDFK